LAKAYAWKQFTVNCCFVSCYSSLETSFRFSVSFPYE
jgi:hypothetical protein